MQKNVSFCENTSWTAGQVHGHVFEGRLHTPAGTAWKEAGNTECSKMDSSHLESGKGAGSVARRAQETERAPEQQDSGAGKGAEQEDSGARQLLGIRGGGDETNIWKIRLQLMKPVTWVPLIWGVLSSTCNGLCFAASKIAGDPSDISIVGRSNGCAVMATR